MAYHLRQDILNFANQLPENKWPRTPDELTSDERNPPKSVTDFLKPDTTSFKTRKT